MSGGRLLVLDIDGVLIDAEASYRQAVAMALAELAPGIPWSHEHYRTLKRRNGFNNDFRLAACALALQERHALDWALDSGQPLLELESRIQALEPHCQPVVQAHYARTRSLERPLATLEELRGCGWDLAIFTGRPPEELEMAFEVLGFRLPAVCDTGPAFRKPRPDGLLSLAERFGAGQILFAGDSSDDAAALSAAAALRPEITWGFAAVGDGTGVSGEEALQVTNLRHLLTILRTGGGPRRWIPRDALHPCPHGVISSREA